MAVEIRPPEPPRGSKRGGLFGLFSSSGEKAVLADIRKTTVLLDKKERALNEQERALNALDAQLLKREEQLKKLADRLRTEEQDIVGRQKVTLQHEQRVRKAEEDKAAILKERDALERETQKLSLQILRQREELDANQSKVAEIVDKKRKELDTIKARVETQLDQERISKAEQQEQIKEHKLALKELEQAKALFDKKKEDLDMREDELDSLRKDLDQKAKDLERREKEIEKADAQRVAALKERDKLVDEAEELGRLQDQAKDKLSKALDDIELKRKEADKKGVQRVAEFDRIIAQKRQALAEEQVAARKKAEARLVELDDTIAAKREELRDVQKDAERQLERIKAADEDLAKEIKLQEQVKKELDNTQSLLDKKEGALRRHEEDLDKIQEDLEKKEEEVARREKELIQREIATVQHTDEMKGLRDELNKDRVDFQQMADGKKAELLELQIQWEEQFGALREVVKGIRAERAKAESIVTRDMVAITDKEKEIHRSVKALEKDNLTLRYEERAIIKRVEELEQAEAEFDRTKKIFDRKIVEFGDREKQVREREDLVVRGLRDIEDARSKVDAAYDRVKRTKELHANIALLEKREQGLQTTVVRLSKKLVAYGHKPEVAPHKATKPEPVQTALVPVQRPAGPMSPMPGKIEQIHVDPADLIVQARNALNAGNYKEVEQLLAKAERITMKMKHGDEKRDLSYDIWDIKTSLRLVTLS